MTLIKKIKSLSILNKIIFKIIFDTFLIIISLWLSYCIRYNNIYYPDNVNGLIILISPIYGIPLLWNFNIYRYLTKDIEISFFLQSIKAGIIISLIVGSTALLFQSDQTPRSIIILNSILLSFFLFISRVLASKILVTDGKISRERISKSRIIIYGAGKAGRQLNSLLSIENRKEVLCFVDDNKNLWGKLIFNLKIISREELFDKIEKKMVDEVIIAIPSLSSKERKDLVYKIQEFPVRIKFLPELGKISDAKNLSKELIDVELSDIVSREYNIPNQELIRQNIENKNVLITGAGGSIASQLTLISSNYKPKKLFLLDISEIALYDIMNKLKKKNNEVVAQPLLGSVLDKSFIDTILNQNNIDIVFHSAAYKHVPLVEDNSISALRNNFFGTKNCVDACFEYGINNFILVSTDKAVYPVSFMGITKRLCELYVSYYGKSKNINYNTVRFGNVIGSSGSVIPLFNDQIFNGGPITITHNDMRRYFMTISEAAELIIQSSALHGKGLIYVLDMGKPVKIIDLAKKMIKLNGFTEKSDENPLGDIEIKITGIRKGEKLDEELFYRDNFMKTKHQKINSCSEKTLLSDEIKKMVNDISEIINNRESFTKEKIVDLLNEYNKF